MEACIITSRLENNAWKRSNSQMVMCTDDLADGGVDKETAIDSYSSVQFDTNSPWYLNKAGRATTVEPAGVLGEGEVGFATFDNKRYLVQLSNGSLRNVVYREGSSNFNIDIVSESAFGKSIASALSAGYIAKGESTAASNTVDYSTIANVVIKNATLKSSGEGV